MFFSYGVFFCRKDENFMIWGGGGRVQICLLFRIGSMLYVDLF